MAVVEPMEQIMSDKTEMTSAEGKEGRRHDTSHIIYSRRVRVQRIQKTGCVQTIRKNLKCNELCVE